ncbi:ABC transporter permease subunit [Pollutimonas harenae]|uniref:ABC transporter permease subunit n=1 Tax=Pollutimonas harenae TaxID=657015 RepID=A0A853H0V3_9BURK|nr:ABC transporter permease subunit [Pollutimonas harenae]NYT85369.1 ABC transporter permease subunit [Pollutimonas harenae]TEA70470.1 ABC transporter permease subunit [Pollutimonas harenae]
MSSPTLDLFITSFGETLLMTGTSGALGTMLGGLLGVFMHLVQHRVIAATAVSRALRMTVQGLRSTPSIIVLAATIPLTHALLGQSNGLAATIAPLTIIATSFVARHVEAAMNGVDHHLIEAAQTLGASYWQILRKVLIPEASADIIAGLGITLACLVGYSALAGAIGGGGLGDLGIRYGYANFLPEVMLTAAVMLIVLAETFHVLGNMLAQRLNQR